MFIICAPLLLIAVNVSWSVNAPSLYNYGFNKFGVSQVTGLSPAELAKAARGWIQYINSSEESINVVVTKDGAPFTLFNEREVAHLSDVKVLFRAVYSIALAMVLYALLFIALSLFVWKDRRLLARGLIGGACLTLGIGVVLGIAMLFNFDQLFLQFHLLSFTNDLWLLDPTRDYLIMLFPRDFWYEVFIFWVLATAVGAVILGVVGWFLKPRPDIPQI